MRSTLTKAIGGLILLAVVATGAYVGYTKWRVKPVEGPKVDPGQAFTRDTTAFELPKVTFTDMTAKAGITWRHVSGAFGRKLLPETMGGGVALFDFDGDGRPDILFINSRPWPGDPNSAPTMALYRNKGHWQFEDVTKAAGLDVPLYGQGVAVGDIDNDGWPDVFICGIGGNRLFRNEAGKRFVDITSMAGVEGGTWPKIGREEFLKLDRPLPWPSSATFFDYDGDGKLDLFVCHYITWSPANDLANNFTLKGGQRAYGPPRLFEGAHCTLYRNRDGTHFEDVSAVAGVQVFQETGVESAPRREPLAKALGVIICDPDEDGWPDLVVANDTVRNFFFHNVAGPNGTRRFEEMGTKAGVAYAEANARGGMGIDMGEYRPGRSAVVIANFANEPSTFLSQDAPKRLAFADLALAVGISGPSRVPLKFGTFFFDYDLDGRLDILTTNGHLEPDIGSLFKEQTHAQPATLFWNNGRANGTCFETVTASAAGSDLFKPIVGRGSAFADLDGDGDLDIVLVGNDSEPLLLSNDNRLNNHWVRLHLKADGRRSNRSAIGAIVTLEAGDKTQTRMVIGARSYLSQSEFPLTFGLGKTDRIDKVTIRWPGKDAGPPQVITNLAIDRVHAIDQDPAK
jgi:hypothetical protein